MAVKLMQARKTYKVKYPALYASKENCENEVGSLISNLSSASSYETMGSRCHRSALMHQADIVKFNCVQRGHQNSLENQVGHGSGRLSFDS